MRAYIILLLGLVLMGCNKTHYYVHEYTEKEPNGREERYKYTTVELDWETANTGMAKIRLVVIIDVPPFEDDDPSVNYLYFKARFRATSDGRGGKRLIMKSPEFVYVFSDHLLDVVCDTRVYIKNNSYMLLEDNKLKGFHDYLFDIEELMSNSDCLGEREFIYDEECVRYGMSDFVISMDDNDFHKTNRIDYTKFKLFPSDYQFNNELKDIKLPYYLESIDDVEYYMKGEKARPGDCR